jgi:hypothetical protein
LELLGSAFAQPFFLDSILEKSILRLETRPGTYTMLETSPSLGVLSSLPREIRDEIYEWLWCAVVEDTTTPKQGGLCWVCYLPLTSKVFAQELKQVPERRQKKAERQKHGGRHQKQAKRLEENTAQQKEEEEEEHENEHEKENYIEETNEEVGRLRCCHWRSYSWVYETEGSSGYARCIGHDRPIDLRFLTAGRGRDSPTAVVVTFSTRPAKLQWVALALAQMFTTTEVFGASKQRYDSAMSKLWKAQTKWEKYGMSPTADHDDWKTVANKVRPDVEAAAFGKCEGEIKEQNLQ